VRRFNYEYNLKKSVQTALKRRLMVSEEILGKRWISAITKAMCWRYKLKPTRKKTRNILKHIGRRTKKS